MTYRLKELMPVVSGYPEIINNTITSAWYSSKIPKFHPIPKNKFNKKIIFEVQGSQYGDLLGLAGISISTTNSTQEGIYSTSQISVYTYDGKVHGFTTNSGLLLKFPPKMNKIDRYYHILIDPLTKLVNIYNPIICELVFSSSIAGYFDNYISASSDVYLGVWDGKNSTCLVNPDVESFKYKPFIEHDLDLYSAILDLPYTPKWDYASSMTSKNIISLF